MRKKGELRLRLLDGASQLPGIAGLNLEIRRYIEGNRVLCREELVLPGGL
jgi:hypothetical protein